MTRYLRSRLVLLAGLLFAVVVQAAGIDMGPLTAFLRPGAQGG